MRSSANLESINQTAGGNALFNIISERELELERSREWSLFTRIINGTLARMAQNLVLAAQDLVLAQDLIWFFARAEEEEPCSLGI
jgi:hypothetical protein